MRINNNITAMNTHRQYSINNSKISHSVAKLSSGYRINSAADDAAGLAISEKMRAQIRGLTMASKNSEDAISLVETAEGALQETHNILQRMRELAVQSGSDTNQTVVDREALNAEFQQLKSEINDISTTTRFNDQNLLDGTFQKITSSNNTSATTLSTAVKSISVARAQGGNYTMSVSITTAAPTTVSKGAKVSITTVSAIATSAITLTATTGLKTSAHNGNAYTLKVDAANVNNMTFSLVDTRGNVISKATGIDMDDWQGKTGVTVNFSGVGSFGFSVDKDAVLSASSFSGMEGSVFHFGEYNVDGVSISGTNGETPVASTATEAFMTLTMDGESIKLYKGDTYANFSGLGLSFSFDALSDTDISNVNYFGGSAVTIAVNINKGSSLTIQSGANEGDNLKVNINKMSAENLGISFTNVATRSEASKAITEVNSALNEVSTQRAELGALSNRLDHKIANLDTSAENLTAAESRIRDVDMAKEMMTFTKNNILQQAGTAMLAQANQLPQGVLQLLR